jgi:hypothetical protein
MNRGVFGRMDLSVHRVCVGGPREGASDTAEQQHVQELVPFTVEAHEYGASA